MRAIHAEGGTLTKENEAKENEALMKEHEASVKEKRH
jgi:hypothetical protein